MLEHPSGTLMHGYCYKPPTVITFHERPNDDVKSAILVHESELE